MRKEIRDALLGAALVGSVPVGCERRGSVAAAENVTSPTPVEKQESSGIRLPLPLKAQPEGEIAFSSTKDDPAGEIYILNLKTKELKRLTNSEGKDWQPAFSPDGQKIAFSSCRDGDGEIYVMELYRATLIQITNDEARGGVFQGRRLCDPTDRRPGWTPDGEKIVYEADVFEQEMFREIAVFLTDLKGETEERVTSSREILPSEAQQSGKEFFSSGGAEEPAISPDGERIIYKVFKAKYDPEKDFFDFYDRLIVSPFPDISSDLQEFVKRRKRPMEAERSASWSPDGRHVAFISAVYDKKGWGDWGVAVVNADGTGYRELVRKDRTGKGDTAWSPDGKWIAFSWNRSGQPDLWAISIDGKNLVQLTDTPEWGEFGLSWRP